MFDIFRLLVVKRLQDLFTCVQSTNNKCPFKSHRRPPVRTGVHNGTTAVLVPVFALEPPVESGEDIR